MTIFQTIKHLLNWYGVATIPNIAKISEQKQSCVLQVLLSNAHLLCKDKRGRIINFNTPKVFKLPRPKWYKLREINYGADKAVECEKPEDVKHLIQNYWVGGIGDCYEIKIILWNEENKKIIEGMGYREITTIPLQTLEELWNGPVV